MHFKDAFQEIVPNGTAELIIRKENPESEEFNGVGIRVRFGGGGESLRMGQLSGRTEGGGGVGPHLRHSGKRVVSTSQ